MGKKMKFIVTVGIGIGIGIVIGAAILSHNNSMIQVAQAGSHIYIDPESGGIILIAKIGSRILSI